MTKPLWEAAYKDLAAKSFGDASQEVLDLIPRLPAGGKVLDLGCGDGRNAIPLARSGFNVTALDISEAGIHKLNTIAEREGLEINTSIADMTTYDYPEKYDLIISHGCLHFIERILWEKMINQFKSHTTSSGFNIITIFTDSIPIPPDLAPLCTGLFHEGELYERYVDWEILLKKSYTFQDEHAGGIRHTHAANKLVAKKLSNQRVDLTR